MRATADRKHALALGGVELRWHHYGVLPAKTPPPPSPSPSPLAPSPRAPPSAEPAAAAKAAFVGAAAKAAQRVDDDGARHRAGAQEEDADAADRRQVLSRRTVVELKVMLRERGFKVGGNKPELVARLLSSSS